MSSIEQIRVEAAWLKSQLSPEEYQKFVISLEVREQLGRDAGTVARRLLTGVNPLSPDFDMEKFLEQVKAQI